MHLLFERRPKMADILAGIHRDALIEEISAAIHQWPEFEQRVFLQAHYQNQSLEAISRSCKLDVEEVGEILKRCDHRLYAFLRSARNPIREGDEPLLPIARSEGTVQ
jgi:DNA-directed RNA polymerase specialized sigma24 family protein